MTYSHKIKTQPVDPLCQLVAEAFHLGNDVVPDTGNGSTEFLVGVPKVHECYHQRTDDRHYCYDRPGQTIQNHTQLAEHTAGTSHVGDEKPDMSGCEPEKLVFLDESGININMTRWYARSKGGSRAVDAVPLWKPQNITVLSSIWLNGEADYTTYAGGTTSERFIDYLKNTKANRNSFLKYILFLNSLYHVTIAFFQPFPASWALYAYG